MNPWIMILAGAVFLPAPGMYLASGYQADGVPKKAARKKAERASPHETASWSIGATKITVVYGRPYKKGRVIFGGLEPWAKVWRTGADEATTLETEAELLIGGTLRVTPGKYSLFTIPNPTEWTLILNKTADQWGAFQYDPAQDYGRAAMRVARTPAVVEQLTIAIESKGEREGVLRIRWDATEASVPIRVP